MLWNSISCVTESEINALITENSFRGVVLTVSELGPWAILRWILDGPSVTLGLLDLVQNSAPNSVSNMVMLDSKFNQSYNNRLNIGK